MGLLSAKSNQKSIPMPVGSLSVVSYLRKKFSRNYTDYGLWVSWKKAMAYLFQPLYHKIVYYLYELDLNKYIGQRMRHSSYVFRLIDHDETDLVNQIETMEEWLSGTLKSKLDNNCLCMVVLDGDRVIGFNYVAIGEGYIPLLKLKVITAATEAWSEQITISSEYRRQGLASALRNHFYKALRDRGITTLYGHRQDFNTASRRSARKYTRGVMVRAEYVRFLGRHRLKCIRSNGHQPASSEKFFIKPGSAKKVVGADNREACDRNALFTTRIEDLK